MKNVLILGGGFAGVAAGLKIIRGLGRDKVNTTLIDRNKFHTFTPSLYEVATSEVPKKCIAIPYSRIFGNKINLIEADVKLIKPDDQEIILDNDKKLHWDYLVVCLGSESAYFDILGLEKYSLPLKKLSDAVKIKDSIENIYKKKSEHGEKTNILIGGGGFSGTELAAEIVNYKQRLLKHHPKNLDLCNIKIIEGTSRLLVNQNPKISEIARKRLESNNVEILFNNLIKQVTDKTVITASGDKYLYDVLIWTGGIRANKVLELSGFKTEAFGQVKVNEYMQVLSYKNIFIAGDCAHFINPNTKAPVPCLGQSAVDQGKIAGKNILRMVRDIPLKKYKPKNYGILIPLKGRYVVVNLNFIYFTGILGWILQQFALLRYLVNILPLYRALRRWNMFERKLKQD